MGWEWGVQRSVVHGRGPWFSTEIIRRENKFGRKYGGGPVEPKDKQGESMKDTSGAEAWGAWQDSGRRLGAAMAVVGAGAENHLGGGRCSLPPQKPEKSYFKS